jgi:uncharacterized membrane protein
VTDRLRTTSAILALVAFAIGAYLTWLRSNDEVAPCLAGSSACETVADSSFAEIAGVPVSALGAAGALLMLAVVWSSGLLIRGLGLSVAATGLTFSAYLTYLEVAEIDAICQWCVASAVTWTALSVCEALRWRRRTAALP